MRIKKLETYFGFVLGILLIGLLSAQGATIVADSPERDAVAAAVERAVTGDTVQVPAGSATWTNSLTIPSSKQITLQGAGMGSTVITQASSVKTLINLSVSRVTGFSFYGQTGAESFVRPTGRGWRLDHCHFETIGNGNKVLAAWIQGSGQHPYGLIDNCNIIHSRVLITGPYSWSGQHGIWAAPTPLGTDNTVVMEDCTFQLRASGNNVDANYGGNFVVRHSTIIDGQIQCHSVQGNNRGTRFWEIYNNTFIQTNMAVWTPIFLRAGTGVIYSNKLVGTWSAPQITFDTRRGYGSHGEGGRADGHSFWDGNLTNGIDHAVGTHTGGTSSLILTDSTAKWTPDAFVQILNINGTQDFSRWVYNVTDGSKGRITANTETTLVTTLSGGTDNQWERGDEYFITGGYPARDQIGRGQDAYQWASWSTDPAPSQAYEPVYIWGQTGFTGGGGSGVQVNNGAQVRFLIQEGRDYIVGTPKPGYTPLVYPHPLRSESESIRQVEPPEDLRILSN